MKTIITALIAATLAATIAVAGVSIAASGDKGPHSAKQLRHEGPHHQRGMHHGPIGPQTTYAEINNYQDGKSSVIRLDQGKITELTSEALKIQAIDDSTVEVAISSATKVRLPGKRGATTADLAVGQTVTTVRKDNGGAEVVMIRPDKPMGQGRNR